MEQVAASPADVLALARKFRFVREGTKHENDGPWVEALLRIVGVPKGSPWCAAYVSAVLTLAHEGTNPLPTTASCDVLLEHAKKHGRLHATPEVGDVFLLMANPADAIHTGFVAAVVNDGRRVETIEGNTNPGGSRDGFGVFERTGNQARLVGPRLQFIRWRDHA